MPALKPYQISESGLCMRCPNCGGLAFAEDAVDVGVGLYIKEPYICKCGWVNGSENDFGFVSPETDPNAFPPIETLLTEDTPT